MSAGSGVRDLHRNYCDRLGFCSAKSSAPGWTWQRKLDEQRSPVPARGLLDNAIGRTHDPAHSGTTDRHPVLGAGVAADAAMQGTGRDADVAEAQSPGLIE